MTPLALIDYFNKLLPRNEKEKSVVEGVFKESKVRTKAITEISLAIRSVDLIILVVVEKRFAQ